MATIENGNYVGTGSIVPSTAIPMSGGYIPSPAQPTQPQMGVQTSPAFQPKPVEPTVMSNYNVVNNKIPELNQRMQALASTGLTVGDDGLARYSDQSFASAPSGAMQNEEGTWSKDGVNYAIGPATAPNPEVQKWNDQINQMKGQFDAAMKAQIDAIDASYQQLVKKQEDVNMRMEASTAQSLIMGGSSRYAQVSSTGIMQAQAGYGLGLIADLQAKKQQAMAQAQFAQQQGDFKFMEMSLNIAKDAFDRQQKAAQELSNSLVAANDAIRKQERESSRDDAVGMLIGQGVSDPAQILNYLNYTQEGKKIGDFTAEEVAKTLKNLTVEQKDAKKLPQDIETYNYLKENNLLPEGLLNLPPGQQYLAYLNMQHLANLGKLDKAGQIVPAGSGKVAVVPGKGANSPVEEQIVRMRLFSKLQGVLNKGALSDADAERINSSIATLRNAGYSEQDIMSELAGFPSTVKTPYNASFITAIASNTDTLDKQQNVMAQVSQLLDSGNYEAAMNRVENTAMSNAQKLDPDNYMGTATTRRYMENIDRIRTLMEKGGVGTFTGTWSQMLGKLKGPQAAAIKSELTGLYASFRKENAGSAVTDSEMKFLEPLFASINDRDSVFSTKLNAFQTQMLSRYNSTRSGVSLPEVDVKQILRPADRLKAYSGSITTDNPFEQSLSGGGAYNILSAPGVYEIPDEVTK